MVKMEKNPSLFRLTKYINRPYLIYTKRGYVMDKGHIIEPLTKEQINDEYYVTKFLSV